MDIKLETPKIDFFLFRHTIFSGMKRSAGPEKTLLCAVISQFLANQEVLTLLQTKRLELSRIGNYRRKKICIGKSLLLIIAYQWTKKIICHVSFDEEK